MSSLIPFASPVDNALISLSIAAQLVLFRIQSGRYIDPEESLTAELQQTARNISGLVPLYRARDEVPGAPAESEIPAAEPLDLDAWAIRRGDLRTALQRLAVDGDLQIFRAQSPR